jgi:hypothetical protein
VLKAQPHYAVAYTSAKQNNQQKLKKKTNMCASIKNNIELKLI